ncbi:PAS domain S-box-containing protein [Verrucomicrobium sp. GAS474]|uniref:ATP-binding protein n=1 Tax=Verrucomicrobium sp. GAS474 TaxID=1882831 RepID=UPI00087964BD|nr:ATP-binding protein [Verrucomicrobium sp. GAS474]SDT97675.1 PAS domain S-box-containing protein [Verrucomicrobium sp. GAS474]
MDLKKAQSDIDGSVVALRAFSFWAAFLLIVFSSLILFGWATDNAVLKGTAFGPHPTKPAICLLLILSGIGVLGLHLREWRLAERVGMAASLLTFVLGLSTFTIWHMGWQTPYDGLGFHGREGEIVRVSGGSLFFVLNGMALVFLFARMDRLAQILSLAALWLGFYLLIGFFYRISPEEMSLFFHPSPYGGVMMTLLSAAVLAAKPSVGLMREIVHRNPGGGIARWLLPCGILFPTLIGALFIRQIAAGHMSPASAAGIGITAGVALFCFVIWLNARRLNLVYDRLARRERLYQVLSECSQDIVHIRERVALFDSICRSAVGTGGFQAAWMGTVADGGYRLVVLAACGEGVRAWIDRSVLCGVWGEPLWESLSKGTPAILNDGREYRKKTPWRTLPVEVRPGSIAIFPIRCRGMIVALYVLHAARPGAFDAEHTALLTEVANDVSHALDLIEDRNARLRAEEQLQTATRRLNEALSKNPTLFYALRFEAGHLISTYISENIRQMVGYTPEEALKPGWFWGNIHPDDAARVRAGDIAAQTPGRESDARDFRFRTKDGEWRTIRDERRIVSNAAGKPVEIIGAWSDVTERLQLEEQFRQAQKFDAVGRLAGGVAHDFNNILTVIEGHAWILESCIDPESQGAMAESTREIFLATKRATRLTRQLLAFSRKQEIKPQPLSLNDVVEEMSKMLRRSAGEHIEMAVQIDPTIPVVLADEGMVEQILLNLVVNARDAMPKGGKITIVTAQVDLGGNEDGLLDPAPPGPYVRLCVIDTGTGIAPEHLTKIFEPFFTTKAADKGTGLGLATVRNIVRQHQGAIRLSSTLGEGTKFQIYFPVGEDVGAAHTTKRKAPARPADLEGKGTLLVMEDDPGVRTLTRAICQRLGYRVVEAATGSEAIDLFDKHAGEIDLLIADIVLPGNLNGKEAADILRARNPRLPVIFTSGYEINFAEYGMNDEDQRRFLRKPCPSEDLARAIRECLSPKVA